MEGEKSVSEICRENGLSQKIIGKQAIEIEILKNGRTVSEKVDAVKKLEEKAKDIKVLWELFGISRSSYYGYIEDYSLKKAKT